MSFGWSAGDIATAISLVIEICKALDDTFGASSEYRDITLFLENLRYTLDRLLQISENEEFEHAAQLKEQVDIMRPKVTNFLNLIEKKYGQNLGKDSSRRFRAFAGKLEWAAMTSTKAKELRDSIGSNMQTIDRLIQFEIQASVQSKIPTQLRSGFSGVEEHVNKSVQPLQADVSQTLSLIQDQYPLIANALRSMEATIQSQSRGNSPQPPAYSPPPPQPPEMSTPSAAVATIIERYKLVPAKNSSSGFEFPKGQQETFSISNSGLDALGSWLRSSSGELLWIKEAPSTKPSLSVAAGLFAAGSWVDETESPRQILANLISSLVHQIIEKLAALTRSRTILQPDSPLTSARLSVLGQQNLKAISASASILEHLIDLATDPFVLILDCFERYNLVKNKMVLDQMEHLMGIFRKKNAIKVFLSASDRKHLVGIEGNQSQKSFKQDQSCFPVNPTLVDMLDSIGKETVGLGV